MINLEVCFFPIQWCTPPMRYLVYFFMTNGFTQLLISIFVCFGGGGGEVWFVVGTIFLLWLNVLCWGLYTPSLFELIFLFHLFASLFLFGKENKLFIQLKPTVSNTICMFAGIVSFQTADVSFSKANFATEWAWALQFLGTKRNLTFWNSLLR